MLFLTVWHSYLSRTNGSPWTGSSSKKPERSACKKTTNLNQWTAIITDSDWLIIQKLSDWVIRCQQQTLESWNTTFHGKAGGNTSSMTIWGFRESKRIAIKNTRCRLWGIPWSSVTKMRWRTTWFGEHLPTVKWHSVSQLSWRRNPLPAKFGWLRGNLSCVAPLSGHAHSLPKKPQADQASSCPSMS